MTGVEVDRTAQIAMLQYAKQDLDKCDAILSEQFQQFGDVAVRETGFR